MHYAPRAIDGPFFPRLKFFRTGGHQSAPPVQFCAATPGIRRSRVSSRNFSLLYLKERRFLQLSESHFNNFPAVQSVTGIGAEMVQYWASLVGFLTSQSNTGIALQIAVFSMGIRIAKHAKASQGISRTLVPLQCILLKQHRNRKKSLSPRKNHPRTLQYAPLIIVPVQGYQKTPGTEKCATSDRRQLKFDFPPLLSESVSRSTVLHRSPRGLRFASGTLLLFRSPL